MNKYLHFNTNRSQYSYKGYADEPTIVRQNYVSKNIWGQITTLKTHLIGVS
jgi:hypothetical protein